jgi:hypothetical protein
MTPPSVTQLFKIFLFSVTAAYLIGCGGEGNPDQGSASGYRFNTSNLHCPDDSLIITKRSPPPLPDGSDVTFHNRSTGTDFDAGPGVTNVDGLVTGLPNNAPSGSYDVIVTPPGGSPVNTGEIIYSDNGC